jgi:phage shock protein PspC (stress-responsive transcriptional regulator)
MPDPNVTSAEQLDDLLREGKISQEEYETLRKAMDAAAADEAEHRRHEAAPRLGKSWKNRQLGGVCGGIAERFGMEPWRVRMVFFLAFLFTTAIGLFLYRAVSPTLLGFMVPAGLTPLAYAMLFTVLPRHEKADPPYEWKPPWRFAGGLAAVWLANLVAYRYLVPHCRDFFDHSLWPPPTSSLTRVVFNLGGSFHYQCAMGFVGTFGVMGFLFGIYLTLPPDKPVRRIYAAGVYATLLLLFILVGVGCSLALFTIANTVR